MTIKNRYRIVQLIAQGGFSKTLLAVDELELPASSCVVKQFLVQRYEKTPTIFEAEAEKLKELGKHPQIPALLDFFESDGYFYLVQELIDGMNLAKIIELEGIFNESQVWKLLNSLLPVLKFIHASDVIHGDIKPANIIKLEKKPGQFVLVGFGNNMGSPEYAAPEQLGGTPEFASDLYSLGVTCIYLLTGVSPFNLSSGIWKEYLHDKISDRFSQILDKLLQNDPAQRFQSADEVMRMMGNKSKILNLKSEISNFPCWQTLTGYGGLSSGVNSVAISPDNQILASGSDDKTIRLWNLETGEVKATLSGHTNFVQSVAFSPDGTILSSASDDKTIKLWNLKQTPDSSLPNPGVFLKTDLLDFTLSEHTRAVKSVAFSPDGQLLASGSWDKTIRLWDWKAKNCIGTISGHQLQVTCVTFSCDGRYLASASFDRTLRLWDLHNLELMQGRFPHQIFYGHSWPVFSVAFSPKGDIIATGSGDNTIKLWDVKTGEEIRTLLGHSWTVVAVVFCPDGETLISASWDKTVKLWQVSTGKEIDTLAGHLDAVSTVTVSPNGQIIASGSKDKTIRLWRRDA